MKDSQTFARRLAIGIVCLAAVPYVAAWANAPDGMRFSGSIIEWPGDASYHLTWPRQAADGFWLFEDKFNGERVASRLIFNWYFLALGLLARLLGTQPMFIWYVAQVLWIVLTVRLCTRLAERFFGEPVWGRLFVVLAVFGGGFGWLRFLFPNLRPGYLLDLERVETIPFAWMLCDVIVPPVAVVTLAIILRYVDGIEGRRPALPALPLLFLALAYVHPHDCLPLGVTLTLAEGVRIASGQTRIKESLRLLGAIAVILILPAGHYLLILQRAPYLWSYVGLQDGYRLGDVALAFPWHLLAAAGCIFYPHRPGERRFTLPAIWLATSLALLLSPTTLGNQHYLLHGMPFALSLLAVEGLRRWHRGGAFTRLGVSARRLTAAAAALALLATSVSLYAGKLYSGVVAYDAWYIPEAHHAAFDWLRVHARRDETAIATTSIGPNLTRFVGLRVRAVEEEQTADYAAAMERQQSWIDGRPEAREWLRETRAAWVVLAKAAPGQADIVPPPDPGLPLRRVFANDLVTVFRVVRP